MKIYILQKVLVVSFDIFTAPILNFIIKLSVLFIVPSRNIPTKLLSFKYLTPKFNAILSFFALSTGIVHKSLKISLISFIKTIFVRDLKTF